MFWDCTALLSGVAVSPDGRTVYTCAGAEDGVSRHAWRNVISVQPTRDFTVRLGTAAGAQAGDGSAGCVGGGDGERGQVFVGFMRREVFCGDAFIVTQRDVYTLRPADGTLCGAGKGGVPYCLPCARDAVTVRCVANHDHRSIAFCVDGVDGVPAWGNVPGGPLHAVVAMCGPGIIVEFVG